MATDSKTLTDEAKAEALKKFMKDASRKYDTQVTTLDDDTSVDVDIVPTGAISLDHALGVGGLPRGRITEIYGPTGGGKTTLALEAAKNVQAEGGWVGFVDAEHALNRSLTEGIGVDPSRFIMAQPDHGEQSIEMARDMIASGVDMIIIDSAAALVPKTVMEADIEQNFMAEQARLLSRFMRVIAGPVQEHNVAFVVINQVRTNLAQYGAPEESTGGKALKFYSSVRVEVRTSASKQIKKGTDVLGTTVTATVKKNKMASPFKSATYDVIFGKGIDGAGGVLEVALAQGVVEKNGNTWTAKYSGEDFTPIDVKLGVGQQKAKDALADDPELFEGVEAATKKAMKDGGIPQGENAEEGAEPEADEVAEEQVGSTPPSISSDEEDFFGLND